MHGDAVSAASEEPDPLEQLECTRARQGGAVTRAQALQCYTPGQLRTLLRSEWRALSRGAYVLSRALDEGDVGDRHALAVACRTVGLSGRHAAGGRSAACILNLPLLGRPPSTVQLVRHPRSGGDVSTSPSVLVATLHDEDVTTCRGVPVTSPARTICDLARRGSFDQGVVAADAALHAGLPRRLLLEAAERCATWPGGRTALRVAEFADERAETPIESLTRIGYHEQGLPAPLSQVQVYGPDRRFVARVDFLFTEQRTVGEADGAVKYRGGDPADPDNALLIEKGRETRLRVCGLEVARNGWDEAFRNREALAATVRKHFTFAQRHLAVAGVRFVQAPHRHRTPQWPLP